MEKQVKVGVISDTHGQLRPEVMQELEGCSYIIHAGDVGSPEIIRKLEAIAPVYAVCGNTDYGDWAEDLEEESYFEIAGLHFYLVHDRDDMPDDLEETDIAVFGHSHRYFCRKEEGLTLLNPGSCGPKRFHLDITMALLYVKNDGYQIEKIII